MRTLVMQLPTQSSWRPRQHPCLRNLQSSQPYFRLLIGWPTERITNSPQVDNRLYTYCEVTWDVHLRVTRLPLLGLELRLEFSEVMPLN